MLYFLDFRLVSGLHVLVQNSTYPVYISVLEVMFDHLQLRYFIRLGRFEPRKVATANDQKGIED